MRLPNAERANERPAEVMRKLCADPATVRRALDFAASRMHLNETERATLRGIADFLLEMERTPASRRISCTSRACVFPSRVSRHD